MALQQDILERKKLCDEAKRQQPDGPWQVEPDRVEFKHVGLDCLITRSPMGNLCGYVAVTQHHPDFGKLYGELDVSVHGGLTYSNGCGGIVCHETEGPDHAWWFGFDCAHSGDLIPGIQYIENLIPEIYRHRTLMPTKVYRDIDYVTREIKDLAEQLASRGSPNKSYS